MKPADLLALLADVYREKLALLRRHEAVARAIAQYDFNNTYQYIIAREDVHLSWLQRALEDAGAALPADVRELPRPEEGKGADGAVALLCDDARLEREFVARWRDAVEKVTNARHKGMLRVILAEALEHQRFFEQAAAGRTDLLGRHLEGAETKGRVLQSRWVE